MNNDNYYTVTFQVDPDVNHGYDQAFQQGDEPWWWYVDTQASKSSFADGPAAGPVPNMTGATYLSVHSWTTLVWHKDDAK